MNIHEQFIIIIIIIIITYTIIEKIIINIIMKIFNFI